MKSKPYYIVYFNANSANCCGWLKVESIDVCFNHGIGLATHFNSIKEANDAAQEYIIKLFEFYKDRDITLEQFREIYTYTILSSIDEEEISNVVSFKWQINTCDLKKFVDKYNIRYVSWQNVADPEFPSARTNICDVHGIRVRKNQYICYNKTTKLVWISDWDVMGNPEKNEYEYLKSKYTDVERYLELKKKFG